MAAAALFGDSALPAAEPDSAPGTYRQTKELLTRHTRVVELTNAAGACVAICPEWQGRVMTSTCGGPDGPSFGFVNRQYIEAGKRDLHFANYGAEDRLWLSPEGGRFSFWFKPGVEQKIENWFTAPAVNEGVYEVAPDHAAHGARSPTHCRMTQRMKLQNASGTDFDLAVTRDVRLLGPAELTPLFGKAVVELMTGPGVKLVAYETVNTLVNQGPPLRKEKGLPSMWVLSMCNAGPKSVIIVPYRGGDAKELGPVVRSDYFGVIPSERLKITPGAVLFSADANCRSKIGVAPARAKPLLGSIDFQAGVLTLAQCNLPEDPTKAVYMNNLWGVNQPDPYKGDCINAYNDGPSAPGGKGMGEFYEIESLSPAVALQTGASLVHCHRTIHVLADPKTLAELARQTLGVELEEVRRAMNVTR